MSQPTPPSPPGRLTLVTEPIDPCTCDGDGIDPDCPLHGHILDEPEPRLRKWWGYVTGRRYD